MFSDDRKICLTVTGNSRNVFLLGANRSFDNICILINTNNDDFTLHLYNISLTAMDSFNAIQYEGSGTLKIVSNGVNSITGGKVSNYSLITSAIRSNNLEINGDGKIDIRGGNGIDYPANRVANKGGYGIFAEYVKLANPNTSIYGGRGGHCKDGPAGVDGYNSSPYTISNQYRSNGGHGAQGQDGCAGGLGGIGVSASSIEVVASVYIVGGQGGNGSNGGNGGNGGKGSDIL
ncbi:MAG: hypothetical protein GX490_03340, partial [Bacilli bacterium]|nr:hypothetical protein [Bacilli bacterium]